MGKYKDAKEDLIELKKDISCLAKQGLNFGKENLPKQMILGLIDHRYFVNGYVIKWAAVRISNSKLEQLLTDRIKSNRTIFTFRDLFLDEYDKYIIFESDELNGFEDNTPEIFDTLIPV
jgi:hypothetical protein